MSLTAGATTVSLGGYAASVPSTSSLPFSYSPAAGAFSGSGSGYEEGGSGGNARFDRAPPVPPPTSLSYARYAYYEVPSTSGGGKEHPLLASAWREPDKFRQCLARAHDVRTENEEANGTHNAYGTFQMPDGSLYAGITRKGALFCRSGFWLEVKPGAREGASREADGTAKRDAINLIRGTRNAQSNFTILEFIAVTFGLISMRAVESNSFVCMDSRGRLYAAAPSDYSSECIFVEEMLENYFNLYSSCSYGTMKKPWYMAIRRTGAPRNGLKTRKRRKAAHFLVVHHDLSPELRLFKPKSPSKEAEEAEAAARAGGKLDLQSLLANTMKHRPVEDPNAAAAAGAAEEVGEHDADADPNERILTIKLEARLIKQRIKKKRKKIPTREERLASDQQRREERKELLARKRIEEQEKLRRLHIEYGKQVQKQHEEHRERLAKEARERAEAARKSLPYSFSNTVSNRTQLTTQSRFNGTMLQVNVLRPKAPHQSQPSPQYTHRDTRRIETTRSPYNVQHRHSPIR